MSLINLVGANHNGLHENDNSILLAGIEALPARIPRHLECIPVYDIENT